MSLLEMILTGISLSLDAVAISIAASILHRLTFKQTLKIALFFGGFQFFMPIIGLALGFGFKSNLVKYGNIIGFLMLFSLGCKMAFESFKKTSQDELNKEKHLAETKVLTLLAITTSIDALVVGITFNFIKINTLLASSIIGLITFILCLVGICFGTKNRHLFGNKIELIGAIILIILAFKILLY
ncbi:MAG: manganese efflux pump [Patescibacteria group bacterium]|jgi:putative Mn2+ efflux pump MntP